MNSIAFLAEPAFDALNASAVVPRARTPVGVVEGGKVSLPEICLYTRSFLFVLAMEPCSGDPPHFMYLKGERVSESVAFRSRRRELVAPRRRAEVPENAPGLLDAGAADAIVATLLLFDGRHRDPAQAARLVSS